MSLGNDPRSRIAATAPPTWLGAAPAIFVFLWALGFPVAKIAIRYTDPMTLLVLRYALSLGILALCLTWFRPARPARGIDWLHLCVVGFLIQGVYFGLCYTAFALGTSAGVVALVVSLQPVLVAVLAPALVGETVGLKGWIGLGLGFVGAIIVILAYGRVETVSGAGIACAVGGLIGMVSATLYERRFGSSQHPLTANAVQYAVGLVVVLPFSVVFGGFHVSWSPPFLTAMAYLVLGNSLVAITLLLAMIRHGRASQVSALFYLVPPGAALMSWLLLGERMPSVAWIGMAVAAIGVALVALAKSGSVR